MGRNRLLHSRAPPNPTTCSRSTALQMIGSCALLCYRILKAMPYVTTTDSQLSCLPLAANAMQPSFLLTAELSRTCFSVVCRPCKSFPVFPATNLGPCSTYVPNLPLVYMILRADFQALSSSQTIAISLL
jgi:hypothetical protein